MQQPMRVESVRDFFQAKGFQKDDIEFLAQVAEGNLQYITEQIAKIEKGRDPDYVSAAIWLSIVYNKVEVFNVLLEKIILPNLGSKIVSRPKSLGFLGDINPIDLRSIRDFGSSGDNWEWVGVVELAIKNNRQEIVKSLLNAGASYKNAFLIAMKENQADIAKTIIKSGKIDPNEALELYYFLAETHPISDRRLRIDVLKTILSAIEAKRRNERMFYPTLAVALALISYLVASNNFLLSTIRQVPLIIPEIVLAIGIFTAIVKSAIAINGSTVSKLKNTIQTEERELANEEPSSSPALTKPKYAYDSVMEELQSRIGSGKQLISKEQEHTDAAEGARIEDVIDRKKMQPLQRKKESDTIQYFPKDKRTTLNLDPEEALPETKRINPLTAVKTGKLAGMLGLAATAEEKQSVEATAGKKAEVIEQIKRLKKP